MVPVTLAKRVSSLPRPTFAPGLMRVPRWRTMMVPPGTSCPPKAFTPSRCALESRPFLELPKPFLCAIRHLHHDVADLHLGEALAVPDGLLVLLMPFLCAIRPLPHDVADLTWVKLWRCPMVFLYCFFRLNLKTMILSPRPL